MPRFARDEVNGLIVSDNGQVFDGDDGEYIGTTDEVYGDALADDEEEFTDYLANGSDLDTAVNAAWSAGQDSMREQLLALREEIAAAREAQNRADGYQLARAEDDEIEAFEAQGDADFRTAIQELAERLGRPISQTEAERIGDVLPDREYDDEDMAGAATSLGITSFSPEEDNQHSRARAAEARADYLNQRAREIEEASDGEEFEFSNAGMPGDLFRNAIDEDTLNHAERLAQSTSMEGLN